MEEDKRYYPDLAELLPDGSLRVPIGGTSDSGERWSGYETIDPTHPQFKEWLQVVENRGPLHEFVKSRRKRQREERRARIRELAKGQKEI